MKYKPTIPERELTLTLTYSFARSLPANNVDLFVFV